MWISNKQYRELLSRTTRYLVKDAWGQWYSCTQKPTVCGDGWDNFGEMKKVDVPEGVDPDVFWQDSLKEIKDV